MSDYAHMGGFGYWHMNPPPPFNPLANTKAAMRYRLVSASMEADGYYQTHTREQCKAEWARRYEELSE